jgi:hypothetical protein
LWAAIEDLRRRNPSCACPPLSLRSRAVPWKKVGWCFALTDNSICSFVSALKARPEPPGHSIAKKIPLSGCYGAQSAVGSMRSVRRFGVWVKGSRRSLSSVRSLGKPVSRIGVGLGGFVRSVACSTVIEGRLAEVFRSSLFRTWRTREVYVFALG